MKLSRLLIVLLLIAAPDTLVVNKINCQSKSITPQGENDGPRNGLERDLNAFIRPYVASKIFSGAVLVAKGGRVLVREGYGMADVRLGVKNTPETSFYIGQMSEMFTAAAILLLEQRGKLRVEDPLSKFVPEFPDAGKITIHDLLNRASGITSVPQYVDYQTKSRSPQQLEETVKWLATRPAKAPPSRTPYEYSSADYILLAYVIERVSGESYERFVKENIFDPLGMKNTGASMAGAAPATRYNSYGAHYAELAPYLDWSILTGSSSAHTTVGDLYTWERALYSNRLLNEVSKRKIFTAYPTAKRRGYVWLIEESGRNQNIITRAPGLGAAIERFPEDDLCVIVLSNVMASLSHSFADDLAAIARGEARTPVPPLVPAVVETTVLDGYTGRYSFNQGLFSSTTIVEVQRKGDGLSLISDGLPITNYLVNKGENAFTDRLYGGTIEFTRDKNGRVVGMLWKLSKANYSGEKLQQAHYD